MDKEKIVKEMAMAMCIEELDCDKCDNFSECTAVAHAIIAFDAGYRKVGENEVIISKEELKRREKNYKIGLGKSQSWVKKLKSDKEQLESENFNQQRTIDTNREEMAKEIYKEARERVNEGIEWLNCSKDKPGNKYMKGVTFGLNLFDKALINAIKKYGVEVLNEQEAKN